jgi:hypothetical protein
MYGRYIAQTSSVHVNIRSFCEILSKLFEEESLSSEADNCLPEKEIPQPIWDPKFHYRVHKGPTLSRVLRKMKPIRILTSYIIKTHFNLHVWSMRRMTS